jgi:hypothetical protein
MPTLKMTAARTVLRRRVAPVALLSATVGLGLLAAAPQAALASPAQPAPAPIVSGYHSSACLDDLGNSSANRAPVVMWQCDGTPEQNWTVEIDGTIQINGKCMDIYRQEKTNKAPVELFTCNGGANQQWQPVGGTLVNPVSHKCLDDPRWNTANGTHLELYTCNGGANQQWVLSSTTAPAPSHVR